MCIHLNLMIFTKIIRGFISVKLLFNEVPVSILVNDIFFEGFFHEAT